MPTNLSRPIKREEENAFFVIKKSISRRNVRRGRTTEKRPKDEEMLQL